MRFFFWFSFVIYWFFLILAPLNVFAKEEWSITKFDKLINAAVSGEVTHGDTLNFFIRSEDNCLSCPRRSHRTLIDNSCLCLEEGFYEGGFSTCSECDFICLTCEG